MSETMACGSCAWIGTYDWLEGRHLVCVECRQTYVDVAVVVAERGQFTIQSRRPNCDSAQCAVIRKLCAKMILDLIGRRLS